MMSPDKEPYYKNNSHSLSCELFYAYQVLIFLLRNTIYDLNIH